MPIDLRFAVSDLLFQDDFKEGLRNWKVEFEKGGEVTARDGQLEINVPAGCTVWLKDEISGEVMFEYDATTINRTGVNDRLSDLNLFWMARDSRSQKDIFATPHTGQFTDYNRLICYYAGIGGNNNTTTRFRRYIGDEVLRPLLPEHDLNDADALLKPNTTYHIRAVACGSLIQLYRDDRKLFELHDEHPYTSGWFGFRTVTSHMMMKNFKVWRLKEQPASTQPAK